MNEDPSMVQMLKTIGPWIISFVALIQYWIIVFWKKYITKGKIEIFPYEITEIGYSNFGPTVTLNGTLRASHKDVFVKKIRLLFTRKKDNSQHHFVWRAFRPNTMSLDEKDNLRLELASGFLVATSDPHKFNIFFIDDEFLKELRQKAENLPKSWHEFLVKKISEVDKNLVGQISKLLEEPTLANAFYEEFSKSAEAMDVFDFLYSKYYLDEGEYNLDIIVETARPNMEFRESYEVSLSEIDVKNLKQNCTQIIRGVCDMPVFYNFIYPELHK